MAQELALVAGKILSQAQEAPTSNLGLQVVVLTGMDPVA